MASARLLAPTPSARDHPRGYFWGRVTVKENTNANQRHLSGLNMAAARVGKAPVRGRLCSQRCPPGPTTEEKKKTERKTRKSGENGVVGGTGRLQQGCDACPRRRRVSNASAAARERRHWGEEGKRRRGQWAGKPSPLIGW